MVRAPHVVCSAQGNVCSVPTSRKGAEVSWNDSRMAKWRKAHPESRLLEWARRRCNDTDPEGWWPLYGARGIKCHLTGPQVKEVWDRDEGHKLKKPSLDRKDPRFDYANWNVRVIEFVLNSRLAWGKAAKEEFT